MTSWWVETPEANRVLAEEIAVVQAAELVSECLERQGVMRKTLAERLDIKPSELSQRFSGRRNLTVRSLAAMVHELGCELELGIRPTAADAPERRPSVTTQRTSDWPAEKMRYTQTGVSPLRGISGAA